MTTVVIHEVEVKHVTGAPAHIIESFQKVIEIGENKQGGFYLLDSLYEKIGKGACGAVFALDSEYVVKVTRPDSRYETKDGEILEALQGLPLVPTLYAYSLDNRYALIQRISGDVVGNLWKGIKFNEFDSKAWLVKCEEFIHGCTQKGWFPNDLHYENCMVDDEGRFWVIDFGLFKANRREVFGSDELSNLEGHLERVVNEVDKKARNAKQEEVARALPLIVGCGTVKLAPKKGLFDTDFSF